MLQFNVFSDSLIGGGGEQYNLNSSSLPIKIRELWDNSSNKGGVN